MRIPHAYNKSHRRRTGKSFVQCKRTKKEVRKESAARSEFSEGIGRCFYSFSQSVSLWDNKLLALLWNTNSACVQLSSRAVCDLLLKLSRPRLHVCEKSVKTNNKRRPHRRSRVRTAGNERRVAQSGAFCRLEKIAWTRFYGYAEFFKRDENEIRANYNYKMKTFL
jgi:hypothetical protein